MCLASTEKTAKRERAKRIEKMALVVEMRLRIEYGRFGTENFSGTRHIPKAREREGGRGKAREGKKEEPVNKTETGITAGALDTGGVFGMDGWTQKRIGRGLAKGGEQSAHKTTTPKKRPLRKLPFDRTHPSLPPSRKNARSTPPTPWS